MASSVARPSEPSTPTTPRSFQNFVHGLRLNGRRVGNTSEGQDASGSHRSLSSFLPVLPNPFGHVHPALRSPTRSQGSSLPSPAATAGRFSAMGSNPFLQLPRSSFFIRRAEAPTVLDHGGNVPLGMASSRFVDEDDEETEMTTMNSSQRRWPSSRSPRRRRRTKKRSTRKSSVPILFPAMQSQRVRAKMLHSIIFTSIILLLVISYFALIKINANINSFQVIFVLIFILLAIALIHSLLTLFLLVRRWNTRQRQRGDQESIFAPSDRAIPVILVRDEEIGIGGSATDDETEEKPKKTVARPPPAYGLWRGSVRADPNLLHWQRVAEQAEAPEVPDVPEHIPRPPSYTPPVQHTSRMDNAFF